MTRPLQCLSALVLVALALVACRLVDQGRRSAPAPSAGKTSTITVEAVNPTSETPAQAAAEATEEPTRQVEETEVPVPTLGDYPFPGGKPPQSQAAEIRPPEMRAEWTRLSAMLGVQVTGLDGAPLGTASDYVINTCETYIIYFILTPAENLSPPDGDVWIIPYEVVTINSGVLNAETQTISLYLRPDHLAGAPAFHASLALLPSDWEQPVRAYWAEAARISNLTTECRVAGGSTVVQKIAYASQLLGAQLKDGLENVLGTVEEAILAPESGKLAFFVVDLEGEGGLVLVPLRVVNIPREALEPEAEVSLVLLTENEILWTAPQISAVEEAASDRVQGAAIQHWNR